MKVKPNKIKLTKEQKETLARKIEYWQKQYPKYKVISLYEDVLNRKREQYYAIENLYNGFVIAYQYSKEDIAKQKAAKKAEEERQAYLRSPLGQAETRATAAERERDSNKARVAELTKEKDNLQRTYNEQQNKFNTVTHDLNAQRATLHDAGLAIETMQTVFSSLGNAITSLGNVVQKLGVTIRTSSRHQRRDN